MEVRFFKSNETKELQMGIDNIWSKNHIFVRDEKLLKYMFLETPSHSCLIDDNHYSFLGAWKDGILIGLLGIMPFKLNNQGEEEFGCCLTNWIVLPEYRTSGAGLALLDKVLSYNPSIILSLGINKNVAKLYKAMKWRLLEYTPRWVGIVNKDRTIEKILGGDAKHLRYWNEVKSVQVNSMYIVAEEFAMDERTWDQFYWKNFSKRSVGFVRDYSFLKWRYFSNQYFDYRTLTCRDEVGNYRGIAIVKIETVIDDEKIGRIVEFISTDQDSAISLANAIINMDKSILFFDFYCLSNITSWGLEAVGFMKELKGNNDNIVVPSRFQPLDLEVTNIMTSIYTTPKFANKLNFIKDDLWYITKGDSDQDRPN